MVIDNGKNIKWFLRKIELGKNPVSIEKDEDYNKTEDGVTWKWNQINFNISNTYYTVYKTLMCLSNLFYKTLGKFLLVSDFFFYNHLT